MKSKHRYLCESWQGLIQQTVTLTSKGYIYYQVIYPKTGKLSAERWVKVDRIIIERFELDGVSKQRRYRNKRQGLCNFFYIRYENIAILLKTKGELRSNKLSTEVWKSIYDEPLSILVSDNISLKVGLKGGDPKIKKITCYFDKNVLAELKAELFELLEHRKLRELEYRFIALNNIPRYSGVNMQKNLLKKSIIEEAKRHDIKLNKGRLAVYVKKKNYKVY